MMSKKRVLILTDYFYPHWTGISKSLLYLIKSLSKEFIFTVLTVKYEKNLKKEEFFEGARILRKDYQFGLSRAKYSFSIILKFLKELKNHDVIFINSPSSNILPVSILTKLFGKKLLIFHQGDLILTNGIFNKVLEKVFDFSSHISFFLANKISTYTLDYAQNSRVLKPFLYKFTPLLMPILLDSKQTVKNNELDKLKDLKKSGKILFGFAGRFVEEKGFDLLFDAIPLIIKTLPQAHFVFAGETKIPYENFYEKNIGKIKNINKYLTFLGLLDENSLINFYKNIDFIVVPSRSDCFNLIQAEAMLQGTPVIVSDIPGARMLVKWTKFGLIFESGNHNKLADAIIQAHGQRNNILKHKKNVDKILNPISYEKTIKDFFG